MQTSTTMTHPKTILANAPVFASIAVKDLDAARTFYRETLGLDVRDGPMQVLEIHGKASTPVLVYPKPDHQPAVFTVLNLQVRDIDEAVDALTGAGITMEHYNGENGIRTDAKGIARADKPEDGPSIAWFTDPSGNIVSVLEGDSA
jgi:catechol 2,3-dioxygenase-like lactoylglutathione lyase family enzyme